jgi:hypothetical protein
MNSNQQEGAEDWGQKKHVPDCENVARAGAHEQRGVDPGVAAGDDHDFWRLRRRERLEVIHMRVDHLLLEAEEAFLELREALSAARRVLVRRRDQAFTQAGAGQRVQHALDLLE